MEAVATPLGGLSLLHQNGTVRPIVTSGAQMIDAQIVSRLATQLHEARAAAQEQPPLTRDTAGLDAADGYRILHAGIALRVAAGERIIGWKMGLTSKAKREQIKIDSPIYGVLTSGMRVADGGTYEASKGIHPRIEPEIAFVMGKPLSGVVTREEALAAVAEVHTAMEILDSRFVGFKDFSLPDVVADNGSASYFVVSNDWRSPAGIALDRIQMRMSVDGAVVQAAESSVISGHPLESLVQLCALIAPLGQGLKAGDLVLAGAATAAVPLAAGHEVRLDADGLPSVRVRST